MCHVKFRFLVCMFYTRRGPAEVRSRYGGVVRYYGILPTFDFSRRRPSASWCSLLFLFILHFVIVIIINSEYRAPSRPCPARPGPSRDPAHQTYVYVPPCTVKSLSTDQRCCRHLHPHHAVAPTSPAPWFSAVPSGIASAVLPLAAVAEPLAVGARRPAAETAHVTAAAAAAVAAPAAGGGLEGQFPSFPGAPRKFRGSRRGSSTSSL